MMEDGTIEYEFFYRPNQIVAHPAVGRSCFLVSPDGIRIHRLTNGVHDRSNLAPDNITTGKQPSRSVALQPESWNKSSVSLKGDIGEYQHQRPGLLQNAN